MEDQFDSCWKCAGELSEVALRPPPATTRGLLLFRCVLLASLTLFLAQFWAESQPWYIRSVMQDMPRLLTVFFGVALFFSSFAVVSRRGVLGWLGFILGVLCMLWILAPGIAYN